MATNTTPKGLPTTLVEAVRYFSDPETCVQFFAQVRWPNGPVCPSCDGTEHSYLKTRQVWKCKGCKRQFSVKVGTIFEDSPIKMKNWLVAVWLIANSKNGISSYELGRAVGLTQKSAWFVLHRIRLAMQTGTFEKLDGTVEIDETFVGGTARNKKNAIRADRARRTKEGGVSPFEGKQVVIGARHRETGTVHAQVIANRHKSTLVPYVRQTVKPGSTVYTDALGSYRALADLGYLHDFVDHVETYVQGQVHTNGIENFWSLLKRGLHGTYVAVNPEHLFRYVDERVFAYNLRHLDDYGRFTTVLQNAAGRRLTHEELTDKHAA